MAFILSILSIHVSLEFEEEWLKHVPNTDLDFAGVAEAGLDGAVEVEQQARGGGVAEVVRVEQVEDLHDGFQSAVAHGNGTREAYVPGEEPVFLAQGVAGRCCRRRRCDRTWAPMGFVECVEDARLLPPQAAETGCGE